MDEFKCTLCGKQFKNKAGLGGHKAAIHGEIKPPQPRLKDILRDGLAGLNQRCSVLEGKVKGLEGARLQQPLGAGTPPIEELIHSITAWLNGLNRWHTKEDALLAAKFRRALRES